MINQHKICQRAITPVKSFNDNMLVIIIIAHLILILCGPHEVLLKSGWQLLHENHTD